jgi:cytochrome c-type biogenesis protein
MSEIINNFIVLISNNMWLALAMAFTAGVVSSFSPCVLSSLPLLIGYVQGTGEQDKKDAFKYSLIFSLGVIITFTVLGVISAVLGRLMSGAGRWWYLFLSFIMFLSGLQLLGILNLSNNTCRIPVIGRGKVGAFFLGIIGGILSSPCSTPILAAILSYVASEGSIILGALMLLLYSIGHCTLIVISGTSIGLIKSLGNSTKTAFTGTILKYISGGIILLVGLYLFSLGV